MSNYYPLTFNRWTIQKRPVNLQPNVSHTQKVQNERSLSIHSLSLRTQNSFVMKKNNIKKHRSTPSKQPIYSVHSQPKNKPKQSSIKSDRNADKQSKLQSLAKNQQRFHRTIQEKARKNYLKDFVIEQSKELKDFNSSQALLNKTQRLFSILIVKPVKYSQNNIIQNRDDSLYYCTQHNQEQKEFSPYYQRKRAVSEKQLGKNHSLNITPNIPSQSSYNSTKGREAKQRRSYRPKIRLLTHRSNKMEHQKKVFLSVKQINLEKRTWMKVQMSAKQRYINYNVACIQQIAKSQQKIEQSRQQTKPHGRQQKRGDKSKLKRSSTYQMGITPWQIPQK